MIVKIESRRIIRRVVCEVTEFAVSVHIFTKDKWIKPECIGGGDEDGGMQSVEWHFEDPMDFHANSTPTEVVRIVSETEEEAAMLEGFPFLHHNKDDLWYIIPRKCVYEK